MNNYFKLTVEEASLFILRELTWQLCCREVSHESVRQSNFQRMLSRIYFLHWQWDLKKEQKSFDTGKPDIQAELCFLQNIKVVELYFLLHLIKNT